MDRYGWREGPACYICGPAAHFRNNTHYLTSYLFHVPLIALLAGLLYRRYGGSSLQRYFFPALAAKLAAGVALGLLYTYHYPYGGDTFLFHREAAVLADWAERSPLAYLRFLFAGPLPDAATAAQLTTLTQPRALVMVKTVSVLHLLTGNSYWLSGAWLSFFSFWGLWSLANNLSTLFPHTRKAAAVSFLFFPSVVFWSAGILKETVAMGIIGFTCAFVLRHWFVGRPTASWQLFLHGAGIFFGLGVLWQLKFYYCAVLVLCLAACLMSRWLSRRLAPASPIKQFLLLEAVLAGLAGAAFLLPGLSFGGLLTSIVGNHDAHLAYGLADPALVYTGLQPTLGSFLLHTPKALVVGLFRPFLWEAGNALQAWVGFENLLLLSATGPALWTMWRGKARIGPHFIVLLGTLHYIVILAVLLSLAAPNYGEIARYKVSFLPFWVYILLLALPPGILKPEKKREQNKN